MSKRRFEDKVVLILGGSRGIGRAIVHRFAAEGAAVGFTYSASPEPSHDTVREIEATGGRAMAIEADSASVEAVREAAARTIAAFGPVDILIASGSTLITEDVAAYRLEDFERSFTVNVRAAFVAMQAVLPQMKAGSRIVTLGSIVAGKTALPGYSGYTMSKGALAAFVRAAAIDLAPRGITINNVQPGPTRTDMIGRVPEVINAVASYVPMGRVAEPEEIANVVAFVASDEASFMTGVSITADGGFLA